MSERTCATCALRITSLAWTCGDCQRDPAHPKWKEISYYEPIQQPRHIAERIEALMADVPEADLAKLPKDGALNHDHYLYGAPKKEERTCATCAFLADLMSKNPQDHQCDSCYKTPGYPNWQLGSRPVDLSSSYQQPRATDDLAARTCATCGLRTTLNVMCGDCQKDPAHPRWREIVYLCTKPSPPDDIAALVAEARDKANNATDPPWLDRTYQGQCAFVIKGVASVNNKGDFDFICWCRTGVLFLVNALERMAGENAVYSKGVESYLLWSRELASERDALILEKNRLLANIEHLGSEYRKARAERDAARAEVEKLKSKNAELLAEIKENL